MFRLRFRYKLTLLVVVLILVSNSIISLGTVWQINRMLLTEVQTRVRLDLNSARQVYLDEQHGIERFLQGVSFKRAIAESMKKGEVSDVADVLEEIRASGPIDIFLLLDRTGHVLYRAGNNQEKGDDLSRIPVVDLALQKQAPVTGTIIVTPELIAREGSDLERKIKFQIESAPGESGKKTLDSAMALASAVPIKDSQKEMIGLLYGVNILNRDYEIVDRIKGNVFQNQRYHGQDIGSATIFQGDVRISTNVMKEDGSRAVGTRLSEEVEKSVLVDGKVWAKRAFVVNDWYISAYEPILDPTGKIIGALYVGLLEAPFSEHQDIFYKVFLGLIAATTVASLILLFFLVRYLFWPIDKIIRMAHSVSRGDLDARTNISSRGELGLVCRAIDAMADAVAEREERLKEMSRRQLGRSEKLAGIGKLAAGIAHEINNPLTAVLTLSSLLRENESLDEQQKSDLDVIISETVRVREIVQGLLDFSRVTPAQKQLLNLNDIVETTMKLVKAQKDIERIEFHESLDKNLPSIVGDRNQIQQVILNLALNACDAMPKSGVFNIRTFSRNGMAVVSVSDTGVGIKEEDLGQIFDPFFTTKVSGKGTGLGLSVSYGIAQQHGGTIEVESEPGRGARFSLILPLAEQPGH